MRRSLYLRLPIFYYGKGYYLPLDDFVTDWWFIAVRLYASRPFIRWGWKSLHEHEWPLTK